MLKINIFPSDFSRLNKNSLTIATDFETKTFVKSNTLSKLTKNLKDVQKNQTLIAQNWKNLEHMTMFFHCNVLKQSTITRCLKGKRANDIDNS